MEDNSFMKHEMNKLLLGSIQDISIQSSSLLEDTLEDFQNDINKNPILGISITHKFALYSTASARTLIVWEDKKESLLLAKLIKQWWKDPSIRKLLNVGFAPSYAINASTASNVMMGICDYIDKVWLKYFGSYNKTRMPYRSTSSLTFVNLVLLKFADEEMENRGLPYGALADMNVCKKCGYPDESSAHNHDAESLVCVYPVCDKKNGHLTRVCGVLQGLCYDCGQVGHMARSHKHFRPEVLKKTYALHKNMSVLSDFGLEIFARRKKFLSQNEFDPMAINSTEKSYVEKGGSPKQGDVIEVILHGSHFHESKEEFNEKENIHYDLSYIWGKQKDYSLPSFFDYNITPENICCLEKA